MTFIEWTKQQEPEGPSLAAATVKTTRPPRLPERIEALLKELAQQLRDANANKDRS